MAIAGTLASLSVSAERRSDCCGGSSTLGRDGVSRAANGGKVLFYSRKNIVGLHVADHHQHRVVRGVILLVKLLHVFDFGGVQIFELPVEIVRIGVRVESFSGQIDAEKQPIRTIQNVDSDLLFHNVALVLQVLDREIERLHTVGFEPKYRIERGNWRRLDVLGEVVPSVTVIDSAAAFDDPVENALGRGGCAFKHHVLEQMSKPGASFRL